MKNTFKFDVVPMILSIVFGTVWVFLGGVLYHFLMKLDLWAPLVVAIYVTGLALSLFLAIVVSNAASGGAKPKTSGYVKTFIVIGVLFFVSMLVQFLYELNIVEIKTADKPTSFIFLIDDSGSMDSWNADPNALRYEAIYKVLDNCDDDFPVAVYSFDHRCDQVLPMTECSKVGQIPYDGVAGGTDFANALQTVIDDIDSGALTNLGTSPRIIMLSDGSDSNFMAQVRECANKGITISTVGFGGAGRNNLEEIANATGGEFVWANDASDLATAMNSAAVTYTPYERDVLSDRPDSGDLGTEIILGVLRTVLMLVIGTGFVLIKVFMFNTFDENNVALITFIIVSAIGALSFEIGTEIFGIYSGHMRFMMCVFFTLLLGSSRVVQNPNNYGTYNNTNSWNGAPMGGMGNDTAVI